MIYVEEEESGVTAYLWHYIVVTPRPLFPREGRFVILLKTLGNTAVLGGVARRSLPSLRESKPEDLVTHCTA